MGRSNSWLWHLCSPWRRRAICWKKSPFANYKIRFVQSQALGAPLLWANPVAWPWAVVHAKIQENSAPALLLTLIWEQSGGSWPVDSILVSNMFRSRSWFGGPWGGRPKNRLSLEHLKYLYSILEKNTTVSESNRGLLVESLRCIAEILIWGDQHDSLVFEWVLNISM